MGELEIKSAPPSKKQQKFDFQLYEQEEKELRTTLKNLMIKNQKKIRNQSINKKDKEEKTFL